MKTVAMETDDTISQVSDEQLVPLRVYIPDLLIQKNLQFQKDELIWDIKQQIIDSLPKELKESFNYGVFCPPVNGKAGKFLDEARPIADYPFSEPSGYVELRYKRRVYKMMNVEEKQIKQLHTRANLRRMLDYVNNGQVEKITKMCARGMDPNFHCPETGESPLTLATTLKQPAKVIMALINGGALLDFRTKDGHTALHRAVEKNNFEALKTLLDLGASPNYKDSRGITPLYYTLLHVSDPQLTELLLHDHALIGTCDPQGWQEVHQACKHGLVQHLEHLLFYGADMNARNASGNTPLHVCAVNDQESCARVLLFRGADKNALNFANQNPYQVAVIAGNLNLGEVIKNHSADDVVPYREAPRYNPRRRASVATVAALSRTHSDPRLELSLGMKPPSPCPSNCSLPPFSSVSCISEASTGSSSTCTQPSGEDSEDTASASVVTEKSVTSDSSGVCTSNSGASYESCTEQADASDSFLPGAICVCIEDYNVSIPGHLQLACGDTVEVIGETDDRLLEGRTADGQEGLFPLSCVQEANTRITDGLPPTGRPRVEGRRELNAKKVNTIPRRWKMFGEPRTVILHKGKKGFGFVLRGAKATSPLMEREPSEFWPSLQYLDDVDKGGVADMAGLKKGDFLLEINGQDVSQASHEHVVTIIRQSGDLVAMTVVTVQGPPVSTPIERAPLLHRQCATLPRKLTGKKAPAPPKRDPRTTLSVGRVRARSMVAGLAEIEALDRTLNEYDSEGRSTKSSSVESIPNKPGSINSDGHSGKIASIRARPSSQRISAAELEQFFARQGSTRRLRSYSTLSNRSATTSRPPKVYGSVAAMKRSRASRTKIADLMGKIHKEFHSTPDLNNDASDTEVTAHNEQFKKKSQSQEDMLNARNSRHSWACTPNGYSGSLGICDNEDYDMYYREAWKSIEDVYDSGVSPVIKEDNSEIYAQTLPLTKKEKTVQSVRTSCPPPSHPPPPPPVGQVVKVDVSKALGEYANVNVVDDEPKSNVMSSFRPGDSAKLYASPEVVMSVGYKTDPLPQRKDMLHPRRVGGGSSLRSHSLPPKIPGSKTGSRSTTSSEAENSGDSGGLYSTFKKTHRQRDSMSSDSGHVSDRGTLRSLKGKPSVTSAYASKFDVEDSDAGSPQNYPAVRTPGHEPFIPEPDYESSEDDDIPTSVDQGGNLSTFGKGDTGNKDTKTAIYETTSENKMELFSENIPPLSPHTEAKRAIQEARERLRFSHKPPDKNATVVFISGKITERKVEKSEIQLHRTEEGRLTGTVVISTTNEPQEPLYLSSSVIKRAENEKVIIPRYPSRDAPASEYAKYRQQILSGMNQKVSVATTSTSPINTVATVMSNHTGEKSDSQNCKIASSSEANKVNEASQTIQLSQKADDGFRIALTGAQKCSIEPVEGKDLIRQPKPSLCSKDLFQDDIGENSSSGVSSDIETQSDHFATVPCSIEDNHTKTCALKQTSKTEVTRDKQEKSLNNNHTEKTICELNNITDHSSKDENVDSDVHIWNRRNLTRNAVSLTNLPPPVESGETDAESEQTDSPQSKDEEDSVKLVKITSPKKVNKESKTTSPKRPNEESKSTRFSPPKTVCKKSVETEVAKGKQHKAAEKSLEESLEVLRLQVDSLGLAAVNEVDVFTELVPPPPEFAASTDNTANRRSAGTSTTTTTTSGEQFPLTIAPPPEFSDYSPQGKCSIPGQYLSSSSLQKAALSHNKVHLHTNSVDFSFLSTLGANSSSAVQLSKVERKPEISRSSQSINVQVHSPCSSSPHPVTSKGNSARELAIVHALSGNDVARLKSVQKEFRFKSLQEWTTTDIADWLDSLFLPEYKLRFAEAGITGAKLANMDSNDLMGLGVKQMGHRLNMERSLKRYLK